MKDMDSDSTQKAGTPSAELDAVIDAVAREMSEGEPSGALRARVLEQIQRRPRRSSSALPRWAWAGAAAATVMAVATAIWVVSPMRSPADTRTAVAGQQSGEAIPAAAVDARQAAPSAAAASRTTAATSRAATTASPGLGVAAKSAQPAAADAGADLHRVPALAEIEPLRFDAVEPDPLRIEAVEMTPFPTIEPIDIPSLDRGPSDTQSVDPKKEN
jgi:hypothetical protein